MSRGKQGSLIHHDPLAFVEALVTMYPMVQLAKLRPISKQPIRGWDRVAEWNTRNNLPARLNAARAWHAEGYNLGFILHRTPIWVLDLDAEEGWPSAVDDAITELTPPQVQTPSGGRHLYFRLPESLAGDPNLKGHIQHPEVEGDRLPLDIKLGGRGTLIVGPGSTGMKGPYVPLSPWRLPPELDPRLLFPTLNFLHTQVEFAKDERPLKDRECRGVAYLKRTPVSVSGKRGQARLVSVCSHLVQYLNLPEDTAFRLLTMPVKGSWNSRCLDGESGKPYPWSRSELRATLRSATDSVPAFGVAELARLRVEQVRDQTLAGICQRLVSLSNPGGTWVPVWDVFKLVRRVPGLEQITQKRLGDAMAKAGVVRIPKGRARVLCIQLNGTLRKLKPLILAAAAADQGR